MNKFTTMLVQDIKFQYRQGFYFIYGVISILYILLLRLITSGARNVLAPVIIFSDPTILGFIFIGSIIYFEKEQGILDVLSIIPLKRSQYIASKCISLTLISLFVVSLIVISVYGIFINWLILFLGVALTSTLFILSGMIITYYIKSVVNYVIIGGIILTPLSIPFLSYFRLTDLFVIKLIPTYATLDLISMGIHGHLSWIKTVGETLYLLLFNILLYYILKRVERIKL